MPNRPIDENRLNEMITAFMPGCALGAAAELDLFSLLGDEALELDAVAERLQADRRATRTLLDALAALGLLEKNGPCYSVPPALRPLLRADSPRSLVPGILHRMNLLRLWDHLAWTVRSGKPPQRQPSIRGGEADRAAFVAAMHVFSLATADDLVARFGPPRFKRMLDVGGASGTWTLAFLKAMPGATATLFDLPDAVEQARRRLAQTEFADRIALVAGDFYEDPLPAGHDFAWVSAIVHQHSREHNRRLFAKVREALLPGGRVAIRDIVMEPSRTAPMAGALFALNMLLGTSTGQTFTFDELAEDLRLSGFVDPTLSVKDEAMNSVVTAVKPL